MIEGGKRQVELSAQMIPPRDEQSGFGRLARVRTRPKVMRISRNEYEIRARKVPEVGQSFFIDPAFRGRVESVSDEEVVVRFEKPGDVIETPFGQGRIREEGENYKVDIGAREGSLVRTGNTIGRIVSVTDEIITVDNRHPFGYETLTCDVTVEKIRKEKTITSARGN
jgi:FKBP-type peptidyl-prolyl cis-trans isomerase 2